MSHLAERYLEADILIIGGGSAGCLAANRVLELKPDLKVVIFEKGDIKYSGCIARGMDALNIVVIPNFTTPELYLEAATTGAGGILDAPPSYEMARRSYGLLKKLEGWGVYFPHDNEGNYRTLKMHSKGKFLACMEEPNLKVIVSRQALQKGTQVINRVMGLRLLTDEGRAAGAIGLNVRTGELVVCRAKAVIITSGGQSRFTLPNSGHLYGTFDYPGNSGDGFLLAYRAGAGLTGMEHNLRPMLIKDANMPLLAITMTRGGRLIDIYNNILMENEFHNSMKIFNQAYKAGRGPLRIRLKHLRSEQIEEIEHILFSTERPAQKRFFKGRGIDFRHRDIELWPTEAQLCGGHGLAGTVVNKRAETEMPGLYAAGDSASVPKQHLTGAFVFGEIAAEGAIEYISARPDPKLDEGQVSLVRNQRNHRFTTAGRHIDVRELEYKVRRLIGDYVVSPKNEYKLLNWGEWALRFQEEIDNQVAVHNGHDLSKLYEVENIVHCASLSARASLERKESRWGDAHYRTDYPETDDKNWLCHIVVRQGEDAAHIVTGTKPIVGLDGKEVGT